jgi:hypothetical protein
VLLSFLLGSRTRGITFLADPGSTWSS